MLARISRSLYELGFEFRRIATEIPGVIENSVADHDLIARAITARKADMAEKAFRLHLERVRRTTIDAQAIVENRRRQQVGTLLSDPVRSATQKIPHKAKKK